MTRVTGFGKPNPRIRVLIADSTRMGSQLVSEVLRRDSRIHVVCSVVGYSEAVTALATKNVDIALISAELDGEPEKGLKLCREQSQSASQVRVIVLLESSKDEAVVAAFRAGAKGVFFRNSSVKPLSKCIAAVCSGQIWAGSRELAFLLAAFVESPGYRVPTDGSMAQLSHREDQVVRCIAEGLTNRQIADRFKLSEHTIKNYIFRIFEKLGISSRIELIIYSLGQFSAPGALKQEQRAGPIQDHAAQARWYRETVERESGVMQYQLAEMYRSGLGVPQDNVWAYVWFSMAETECHKVRKQSHTAKINLRLEMTNEQIAEAEGRIADLVSNARKGRAEVSTIGVDRPHPPVSEATGT